MKVKYLHESSLGLRLTKGKYYDVIEMNDDTPFEEFYVVIGDNGIQTCDWCSRFMSITEIRDIKLNELLQ